MAWHEHKWNSSSTFTVVCYCIVSSTMGIVNKLALVTFPHATLLVCMQYAFCAAILAFANWYGLVKLSSLETLPWTKLVILSIFFHLTILSGSKVILYGNVDTYIAFRSVVPVFVTVVDGIRFGRTPELGELISLLALGVSGMSFVVVDDKFEERAYIWGAIFIVVIVFESVWVKHVFDTSTLSVWDMGYCNNFLSFVLSSLSLMIFGAQEFNEALQHNLTLRSLSAISGSCFVSFAISLLNFRLRQIFSATTSSVLGTANKFISILINTIAWSRHSSLLATYFLLSALGGTILYSKAGETDSFLDRKTVIMLSVTLLSVNATIVGFKTFGGNDPFSDATLHSPDPGLVQKLKMHQQSFFRLGGGDIKLPCPPQVCNQNLTRPMSPSYLKCLGDSVYTRSCLFSNIYVRSSDGTKLIYVYDKDAPKPIFEGLTNPFVLLGPVPHRNSLLQKHSLQLEFVSSETLFESQIHTINSTSLLFEPYGENNFGHFIIDCLYPIFAALVNLNSFHEDVQLYCHGVCKRIGNQKANYSALLRRPALNWNNMLTAYHSQGFEYVSFEHLVVGTVPYGISASVQHVESRSSKLHKYYESGVLKTTKGAKLTPGKSKNHAKHFSAFRRATSTNLGVNHLLSPQTHCVTVIDKTGKRVIKNVDAVVSHIRQRYSDIVVRRIDPSRLSFKEQVSLMMNTTITISPRGGVSFIGLYQARGTYIIIIESPDEMWRIAEYEFFWAQLNHIKTIMYKLDVSQQRLELDCPSGNFLDDNCDYIVNFDKLDKLMDLSFYEMSLPHR